MKRFLRAKSRVLTTIVQPLFFLFILGFGFNIAVFPGMQGSYINFLAPGIIAMAILFSSMFTGVSVLWDKQSGFLQEVLVAPVSRLSIVIGRTLGGATIALFQGIIIMIIAIALGVPIVSIWGFATDISHYGVAFFYRSGIWFNHRLKNARFRRISVDYESDSYAIVISVLYVLPDN